MGRQGKWEYFRVIYGRYCQADRKAKREMLNEFCLTTGYHRKYAIRILNGPAPGKRPDRPVRKRGLSYGHELLSDDGVALRRVSGNPGLPGVDQSIPSPPRIKVGLCRCYNYGPNQPEPFSDQRKTPRRDRGVFLLIFVMWGAILRLPLTAVVVVFPKEVGHRVNGRIARMVEARKAKRGLDGP